MERFYKSHNSFFLLMMVISGAGACIIYLLPRLILKTGAPASVLGPSMLAVLCAPLIWGLVIKPMRAVTEMHIDRTRITLENVVDAVIHFDSSGKIESFNAAAARMFGYAPSEMTGRNLAGIISQDIWTLGKNAEITARHRNGMSFPAEIFVSKMQVGKRTSFVAIVHDVSKRKQAETALLESERRYHSLFQNMLNGFVHCRVLFDKTGAPHDFLYLDVNDAFYKLTGLGSVIGAKVSAAFPALQPSFPLLFETYARVATTGTPETFEMLIEELGLWLYVSAFSPDPGHLVAIFENITARKKAEKEIMDAKADWERTFDAIVDPVMILDTNHRVIKANKACIAELGQPQCDIAGAKCCTARHECDTPLRHCPNTLLLRDGKPHSGVVHDPRKGKYYNIEVSPLYGPGGELQGSVHFSRDITEQKSLEKQLQHSQKMEAVGTLAGGVAHDFNNILTAIIGYGTLVQMRLGDDPARAQIHALLDAADRAADLTRSLLTFSRQEKLELRSVDLNKVAAGVEKMLRRLIRDDVEMHMELNPAALNVMADKGQIEQVLMNLSINAQDAIDGTGTLTISTDAIHIDEESKKQLGAVVSGRHAVLTCSDSGHGMDDETQQRIFEPFFTTKEVGKGTGLGLSIVYGIVKQHGGFIACNSRIGEGTTFRVYLPVTESEPQKEKAAARGWVLPTGTETVLVAEDDDQARGLLRDVLEKFGYRVLTASNGEEALSQFRTHRDEVRLVVLDSIMPKMNGREAFEQMQLMDDRIRAIYISGYPGVRRDIAGADIAFLTKPIHTRKFLTEVRRVLDDERTTSSVS